MVDVMNQASHCFLFEKDFVGNWRCIPLCVRRKLDLIGVKLKLSHWLEFSQEQRQSLVDWPDQFSELNALRAHLRTLTQEMADGMVKDLPIAMGEAWQTLGLIPEAVQQAALERSVSISINQWAALFEVERFALCKLARPGHDHHNLDAAFSEVLG